MPARWRWGIAMPAAWIALAGCASPAHKLGPREDYAADGAVSADIVDRADAARDQPAAGSTYFNPLPVRENAWPDYPPELLARRLPETTVVARIVVDETGAVARADLVDSSGDEPAFADAVLSAVRGWTVIPLKRITGDKVERLPFTQDYRFTFRQVNGRVVVDFGGGPG